MNMLRVRRTVLCVQWHAVLSGTAAIRLFEAKKRAESGDGVPISQRTRTCVLPLQFCVCCVVLY
jgi:hypothetical protein